MPSPAGLGNSLGPFPQSGACTVARQAVSGNQSCTHMCGFQKLCFLSGAALRYSEHQRLVLLLSSLKILGHVLPPALYQCSITRNSQPWQSHCDVPVLL